MAKVKFWSNPHPDYPEEGYRFYCPGCKTEHQIWTKHSDGRKGWDFNGDMEKPTIAPSILVYTSNPERRCHSFVRNGQIEYLGDCFHELRNITVSMVDVQEN